MPIIYTKCPCCGQQVKMLVSFPDENCPDKDMTMPKENLCSLEDQGMYFGVVEEVSAK